MGRKTWVLVVEQWMASLFSFHVSWDMSFRTSQGRVVHEGAIPSLLVSSHIHPAPSLVDRRT